MAQHLCVKTGQIGVLVCNNLEIETSLQQQHENGNKSTQVSGDCPTQQIALHDKFERTEQNSNCTSLRWREGFFGKKILQRRNITIGTNQLSTIKRSSSYFGGEHNMSRGSHLHLDCKVERRAGSENRR